MDLRENKDDGNKEDNALGNCKMFAKYCLRRKKLKTRACELDDDANSCSEQSPAPIHDFVAFLAGISHLEELHNGIREADMNFTPSKNRSHRKRAKENCESVSGATMYLESSTRGKEQNSRRGQVLLKEVALEQIDGCKRIAK